MKRILASLVVLSMSLPGSVGCSDLTSTKSETNASTPDRSTTIITEKEARTTGDTNVIIGTPNDQRPAASVDQQSGASNDKKQRAAGEKQPSTPQNPPTDESKKADKK